jgi:hypothetical protein
MTKLWQYTEAQAEAMSAANAAKVLAEQEELEKGGRGEAWYRELEGYVLDYDSDSPTKDSNGNYILAKGDGEIAGGEEMWRHWSKIYPQSKMMRLTVGEARSLHPKVKEILEQKVKAPMKAFKEEASEETKRKYEAADEGTKGTILAAWLKSKGKNFDGGRHRKTRKGRKGGRKSRRTTRKY